MEKYFIIDLFCCNGSTWYNKSFFIDKCLKNDIRSGKYVVGSTLFNQTLDIKPDTQVDMLNFEVLDYKKSDVVYLDPPHLLGESKSGIMYEKYGSLDSLKQLEILVENCNRISDKFLIIKWNDRSLDIDTFLNYFRKYFVDTIKFGDKKSKSNSFLIVMVKKTDELI